MILYPVRKLTPDEQRAWNERTPGRGIVDGRWYCDPCRMLGPAGEPDSHRCHG